MSTKHTQERWTGSTQWVHASGYPIERPDGSGFYVTCEAHEVPVIAAAPEMLSFIERIAERDPVFAKGHQRQDIEDARALAAKAKGL